MTDGVRVDIEVVSAPFVNHAMNHNRIPFLQRVSVAASPLPVPAEGHLRVRVQDDTGEVISRPWQRDLTVHPERPIVLDNPDVHLDPAVIATLEEEAGAEIIVEFSAPGLPDAVSHTPIRVLAGRQWRIEPHAEVRSVHLLAAFVQPNHPAVAELLPAVSDLLVRRTGSGSLAGTGRRVDEIVHAVVDTLVAQQIAYAEPPASWGLGQQIRGPDQVLHGRVGTCLDTTVLMASVLEHLGIHPVLWLAYGHAFVGWWRDAELALPDAASLQTASAVNAVDLDLMGVCETTLLTREKRAPKDVFRRSQQVLKDSYFTTSTQELVAVVDVAQSRLMGVLPVPARRQRPDGVVEVVEYQAPTVTLGEGTPAAAAPGPARTRAATPVPPRVQAWKNELLDLTLRNPLLNLGRVTQLPLVIPDGTLGTFARMLSAGDAFATRAVDNLVGNVIAEVSRGDRLPGDALRSMLAQKSLFSRFEGIDHKHAVERLRYRARTALQESGANLLALTLGELHWRLDEREFTAPLLLAPAEFRGIVAPHRFALDPAGQITVNQSLLEKLRLEFGFTVPELTALPLHPDTGDVDVDAVLRAVRGAIAEARLPFRVSADARLAIIAYTGYLLWRDLDEHWEQFLSKPFARHLALTPTEPFADAEPAPVADLDALVASAPIPMDGSQAEAVGAARAGRSFVLEGPPGTGKSQTITNLIADQMAQGRTVLFVAEKGAALDVVRARLEQVGLLPFALDLHDHNARPMSVRRQLKAALALHPKLDVDAYRIAAQEVSACAATLSDYARRLHEPNAAGLSLYAARSAELAHGDGPALPMPPDAAGAVPAVQRAVPGLAVLGDSGEAWGFARTGEPRDVLDLLPRADAAVPAAAGAEVLQAAGCLTELRWLRRLLTPGFPSPGFFRQVQSPAWQQARAELGERTRALVRDAEPALGQFFPAVLLTDLGPVRQQLREAESSFFLGRKGRLVRAAAPALEHLRPGVHIEPERLPALVDQLAGLAARTWQVTQSWRALLGAEAVGPRNPADPQQAGDLERLAGMIAADAGGFAALPAQVRAAADEAHARSVRLPEDVAQAVDEAAAALTAVFAATGSGDDDQRRWCQGHGLLTAWQRTAGARAADRYGSDLSRWVEARTALAPLEEASPDAAWALLTGQVAADDAVAAVERGLARTSLEERFATGGFRAFDPDRQNRTVDRFLASSADLRQTLTRALPAAVIERRPFTPGRLFGKVAAMEREINRSRGGLSVRQLLETYGDVIAEVTPCVLVSPDSLARFIPPGALDFDVVVFDEASQIRVPDAIGAIGRATAVVVAGDSKQMPPSAFAQLADTTEEQPGAEEFTAVRDEESILSEAVMAGMERLWLNWHYRSRDESLIAFSNAHYYDDRLFTFPAVPGRGHDQGLSFTRVDGRFLRSTGEKGLLRTNPVEAAAVADEVLRRWRTGERSIGVVTFNIQQRALIENLLLESGEPELPASLLARNDGIFVKNLENVQGDERDVIIFSTGFSANDAGVLPLNFGPLNRAGGERRLNVAVSRARRRILVFSSFDPEDIRTEQTSSVGIAHLRRYLEVARDGAQVLDRAHVAGQADRHRDQIAARLREAGLQVQADVGLSEFRVDLAVGLPGEPPVLAVLLDGPGWAARRTTGDRDGLPQTVLAGQLGWPRVERVWLPDWLRDQDDVVRRLVAAREGAATARTVGEDTVTWSSSTSGPVAEDATDNAGTTDEQPDTAPAQDDSLPEHNSPPADARSLPGDQTPVDGHPLPSGPSSGAQPLVDVRLMPGDHPRPRSHPQADDRPLPDSAPGDVRPTPEDHLLPGDHRRAGDRPLVERVAAPASPGTAEAGDGHPADTPPGMPGPQDSPNCPGPDDPWPADLEGPGADPIGLARAGAGVRTDFVPFEPRKLGSSARLDSVTWNEQRRREVAELAAEIVRAEGPASVDRICRQIVRCYGLSRLTATRKNDLLPVLPATLRRDEEGFVYPDTVDPLRWEGYRATTGTLKDRPLDEVALTEIANAAVDVVRTAMGIPDAELLREVIRIFGGTRVSTGTEARLRAALDLAERQGRITARAGMFLPA